MQNTSTVRYPTRAPYFSKATSLAEVAVQRDPTQIKIQPVHTVTRLRRILQAKRTSSGKRDHDSRTHQGGNHPGLDGNGEFRTGSVFVTAESHLQVPNLRAARIQQDGLSPLRAGPRS